MNTSYCFIENSLIQHKLYQHIVQSIYVIVCITCIFIVMRAHKLIWIISIGYYISIISSTVFELKRFTKRQRNKQYRIAYSIISHLLKIRKLEVAWILNFVFQLVQSSVLYFLLYIIN